MELTRVILLIEDCEEDFLTARRLLSAMTDRRIERCADAASAADYLNGVSRSMQGEHAWPDVILLDLNLPGEDGRTLLRRLKQDDRLRRIPVVVLTTSANPKDLEFCYENGAAGYIVKPVDLPSLRSSLKKCVDYWLHAVTLPPPESFHES